MLDRDLSSPLRESPRRLLGLWLPAVLLLAAQAWNPVRAAADTANYDETANCIAVMQTNAELASASGAERFIVERIAQVQMKRMLQAAQ